ncbi:unnamed protein product [Vitrella brassicaformis CCMP3155]|uniref:Uncharacterized protein n=2 Tax=Vitrella brassicaformis TaxID=1169539 RepID=A0A0G4EMX8_VITBC|nr:unnamed protein product [Vitrella brassicaformis CCMP3155]|mmetsp:Transcript_31548/g.78119  ORF Transcript_31548/g.78119 Transcript_31548/m.78119 type:complete len:543 (+) Transcript_31548:131-1759(+)|eukprot:CEL98169.1 unnamed protein product [Vitrella brassicaformis CCMP3155]
MLLLVRLVAALLLSAGAATAFLPASAPSRPTVVFRGRSRLSRLLASSSQSPQTAQPTTEQQSSTVPNSHPTTGVVDERKRWSAWPRILEDGIRAASILDNATAAEGDERNETGAVNATKPLIYRDPIVRPLIEWTSTLDYDEFSWSTDFSWPASLITLPNSRILRRISNHMLFNVAWSMVIATVYWKYPQLPTLTPLPHALLGSVLGLLLAFRIQQSYDRFLQAVELWSTVINNCRGIKRLTTTFVDNSDLRANMLRFTAAYGVALKQHLRQESDLTEFSPLINAKEMRELFNLNQRNKPLAVCSKLTLLTRETLSNPLIVPPPSTRASSASDDTPPSPTAPSYTNELLTPSTASFPTFPPASREMEKDEFGFWSGHNENYGPAVYSQMADYISALERAVGDGERLAKTPVPPVYARHTSRILSIGVMTLPLVLAGSEAPYYIPFSIAMISWAFFGTEELGLLLGEPFRVTRTSQGITKDGVSYYELVPVTSYCQTMAKEITSGMESKLAAMGGSDFFCDKGTNNATGVDGERGGKGDWLVD